MKEKDPYDFLAMIVKFSPGDSIKILKTIKNDGTYAGLKRGEIIAEKGETGYIVKFLGYAPVFEDDLFEIFLERSGKTVICRSCELEIIED